MDTDFDVSEISVLVENIISMTCFANLRIVQLKLKTNYDLDHALKFGEKIKHCLFCVTQSIKSPSSV